MTSSSYHLLHMKMLMVLFCFVLFFYRSVCFLNNKNRKFLHISSGGDSVRVSTNTVSAVNQVFIVWCFGLRLKYNCLYKSLICENSTYLWNTEWSYFSVKALTAVVLPVLNLYLYTGDEADLQFSRLFFCLSFNIYFFGALLSWPKHLCKHTKT